METFEICGDCIELNKLLKASACCETGGMAKLVIEEGRVQVDGKVEYRKRRKVKNGQIVAYDDLFIQVVRRME